MWFPDQDRAFFGASSGSGAALDDCDDLLGAPQTGRLIVQLIDLSAAAGVSQPACS